MTNYNERLDKIFPDESKDTELQHHLRNVWHDNFSEQEFIDEMEAYITSLIKELVAEAKPEYVSKTSRIYFQANSNGAEAHMNGYRLGIREYEQNLLKALDEK